MFEIISIFAPYITSNFFGLFGIGIIAFIASNIDDTFILILLFTSLNFQIRQIIAGQFIGIAVLIKVQWGPSLR
jgi:cadmium resistance protein CadD (predicted permease)